MDKFSILYVDDEESNLRVFKDTFRRNYNVYTATSAKEGIRILENNKIDLILSDQRMPEMTGIEFLRYTSEKYPNINRILVTGYTDFDAVENAINKARVFQYIQKPWKEEKLNNTMQDALRLYKLELENERQKEELIIAKKYAEENDRQKAEFLNNLSHEIRTPLNGIVGFSNLLKDNDLPVNEKEKYISIVLNCSKQLVETIDHILAYSKLITKKVVPQYSLIHLNFFITEIHSIFNIEAGKKNLEFSLLNELAEDYKFYSDWVQLNSLLYNILDNAFKFTENGAVRLGYQIKENNIIFIIEDTGVGIAKEYQMNIFNWFSRGELNIQSDIKGLGLGLSIARENANLLNAEISFESEKGKGTTFYISIPFITDENLKPEMHTLSETKSANKYLSGKYTVLIAEDNDINYMYLTTLIYDIIGKDTIIIHALNGKEAVDYSNNLSNIDLILMDINMPVMNGYEATTKIKKIKPEIPIMAQTAYSTIEDQKKAKSAGCDEFIAKPINTTELQDKIKKLILLS